MGHSFSKFNGDTWKCFTYCLYLNAILYEIHSKQDMKQLPIRKYDFKSKLKLKCLQNIRIVVIAITWCTWNLCADTRCVFHCLFNESKFAYLFADMKIHENKQGRGLSCLVILCTILWYLSISRNANINGVWWNVWVFSFH